MQSGAGRGENIGGAEDAILAAVAADARLGLPAELCPPGWPEAPAGYRIRTALTAWAQACPRPLVLFLDEVDALEGSILTRVLAQLRDGFEYRPDALPASIALCGVRDARDYRIAPDGGPRRSVGPSPFNIVESVRLGDFTVDEVRQLYDEHTTDTGQVFGDGVVEHVHALTAGQPWLVNALAAEIIYRMGVPRRTRSRSTM